jgi:hypothetical protein
MRAAAWMAAGSLACALVLIAIGGRARGPEVVTGMLGPLAAASVSWVLTERTFRREPGRLTGVLMTAFAAKAMFFAAYVAVMLKGLGLQPVPFVATFTGYFIALYLIEALLMRRLFARSS